MIDHQNEQVGEAVQELAYHIFCECGVKSDYCVQHVGFNIVFGKTNRLILGAHGWRVDESYCSPEFIKAFGGLK